MFSLLSKKLLMMGVITITLPFGAFTIGNSGAGALAVTQAQNPQVVQVQQSQRGQSPAATNVGINSNTSENWSGYEATGGTYTAVSGTWTIPTVADASTTEADATWVGIGGISSTDLIQAGTQAVINGSGAPTYQAWYEMLPAATTQVPLTVSQGDSITASLSQTSPGLWSVSIRDNTTGQSYQTSLDYNSSLSSAEWIEEMPSDGTRLVPLDNFGTVSFSDGMTTENGNSETISGAGAQALTMVNRNDQILASPSSLGADDESFTVTRSNVASTGSNGFGGGSGYVVITRGNGGGGWWRRTGVGIQGFAGHRPPTQSSGGVTTTSGNPWQNIFRILQEQQQGFRNGLRNSYRF